MSEYLPELKGVNEWSIPVITRKRYINENVTLAPILLAVVLHFIAVLKYKQKLICNFGSLHDHFSISF